MSLLLVGAGGIAAPVAIALAAARVGTVRIADDDVVEAANLHRQILFDDADVGQPKVDAFARALRARAPGMQITEIRERALPGSIDRLLDGVRVVIDATDNFASRFLLADACFLRGVAVVHAAAIRWNATVLAVAVGGKPCYRCLFEDLPRTEMPDCSSAGIVGPICGVAGSVAADRAIRLLAGDESVCGSIVTYDGRRDLLRSVRVARRVGCALCGSGASIGTIDPRRYSIDDCPEPSGSNLVGAET